MRGGKVLDLIMQGYKMRKVTWFPDYYLYYNTDTGEIADQAERSPYFIDNLIEEDWEIYEKPLNEISITGG